MPYQWILFDADDTLLDFVHSSRLAFSSMLESFGIEETEEHFPLYKQCNHAAWQAYEAREIDAQMLRRRRFADFRERAGLGAGLDPMEMNRVFLEHLIGHTRPLDGALELLNNLAGKVRLGLITNGLKEVQRPRIRHVGMEGFFDVVVVSDEIGVAKPDARFFEVAHAGMGLPAKERVLVVGDSFSSDVMGAHLFGYASCWFNPQWLPNPNGIPPHLEIQALQEVLDHINGHS